MKKVLDFILILCDEKKTFWSVFASICLWIMIVALFVVITCLAFNINAVTPFIVMACAMTGMLFGFMDI